MTLIIIFSTNIKIINCYFKSILQVIVKIVSNNIPINNKLYGSMLLKYINNKNKIKLP